jgi:hypothetical protein
MNLCPRALDAATVDGLAAECGISRTEAMAYCLAAHLGLDAAGADRALFRGWLLPSLEEQSAAPYREDLYFKNVRIPQSKLGEWELKQEFLAPFEPFVCRDLRVLPDGRMLPQIGFFTERYDFPAILENGREWMTLQPNETVTTLPAIEAASGRVLTFGVGLGYFTYHAACKREVESVTVVDVSEDALSLFRTHILPHFEHPEKVRTVCMDAFAFADRHMAGNFDFVFADIWHDAGDGKELYLRMKAYEEAHPDIRFSYWLEDTIRCYLNDSLWDVQK